ncbi:MAG: hypothetical protein HY791_38760 [Deltaproteobacteria bacterium]|nr:hypothetical protein [Deltaproteobacteria bacterium]
MARGPTDLAERFGARLATAPRAGLLVFAVPPEAWVLARSNPAHVWVAASSACHSTPAIDTGYQ